jgi:hypothetical protein
VNQLGADDDLHYPAAVAGCRRRSGRPGSFAKAYADPQDALADIATGDAAYGTVPPELFARGKKLRWICASRAGLVDAYSTMRWSTATSS